MKFLASTAAAICFSLLLGCSEAAAPTAPQSAKKMTATLLQHNPTPMETENDRICKKMYAISCSEIPHLPGPMNAAALHETRACLNETIAKLDSGKWVAENKYQDPTSGERYGDLCIAVSI